jgi:hypothetical protein
MRVAVKPRPRLRVEVSASYESGRRSGARKNNRAVNNERGISTSKPA